MKLFQIFRSKARPEPEPEDIGGHINTVRANLNWDPAIPIDGPSAARYAQRVVAEGQAAELAMAQEETESEDIGHINTMRANLNWDAAPKAAAPIAAPTAATPDERAAEIAPLGGRYPLPEAQ